MKLSYDDPLLLAARSGQIDHIREALEHENEIDQEKLADIAGEAARDEQLDLLDMLVAQGWTINPKDPQQPFLLLSALRNNKTRLVTWLLNNGADPSINVRPPKKSHNRRDVSLFTVAAKYCALSTLIELVDHGACIEDSDALSAAATSHQPDRLEKLTFLIEKGLAVDRVERVLPEHTSTGHTEYTGTALHAACKWGYEDSAAFLLEHGADPTLLNSQNQSIEDLRKLRPQLFGRGWSMPQLSTAAKKRTGEEIRAKERI